jgi:hypothetical protein
MAGVSNQNIERLFLDRWHALEPEAFDIVRIIWSQALQDQKLASQYLRSLHGPVIGDAYPNIGGLSQKSKIQAQAMTAMFLGITLLRLFADPAEDIDHDALAKGAARILAAGVQTPEPEK